MNKIHMTKTNLLSVTMLAALLGIHCFATVANAGIKPFGTLEATLPFSAGEMIADPTQPYIYTDTSNYVEIINTQTLTVIAQINLGTTTAGIALSPDGKSLYVAEPTTGNIAVISTQNFNVTRSLTPPSATTEIAAGSQNRLFVLDAFNGAERVQQIDATTGSTVGPAFPDFFAYYGNFQISPDLNTLYYGQHGLSPSTLYAFNVSTQNVQQITTVTTGSNGKDVTLSHNGQIISQPNGAPYQVNLPKASDLSTLGTLATGPYPSDMAFSPDDQVAYTTIYPAGTLTAYSTKTFTSLGSLTLPGTAGTLVTDSNGQDLFVSIAGGSKTTIYSTGRSVPEPGSLVISAVISITMLRRPGTLRKMQGTSPLCLNPLHH